jgi:transposase-like protein
MYKVKNPYYKNSKIDETVFIELLKHFANDLSASDAAKAIGVSVRSVNNIYLKLRMRIHDEYSDLNNVNHFFTKRDIFGRKVVCSIQKQNNITFVDTFTDDNVFDESLIDRNASHEKLIEVDKFIHFAKDRLKKFKGLSSKTFNLHLKETEFRFNHRKQDLNEIILELIKSNPI